ncbi:DUF3841 domain-containing protein [Specibacter sp. NPDC057265]|uniref:DUF3841 domain-containing protein n=1 Tax=Specibacter sp. NPDC057265 TaxID=3346075 RepID=UPI0036411901
MASFPIRSAPPDKAVPPGRIGYDLDADVLLLHTVQTNAAFEELLTSGMLRQKPELADPWFPDAYDWMNRMMAARLPTSGNSALWLWAKIRRRDLVTHCRYGRGQVLLTCRIPRERVLLSHDSSWYSALNCYVAVPRLPGESDDERHRRWSHLDDDFNDRLQTAGAADAPVHQWPKELREEMEGSWECIFDRKHFQATDYWQATVHEIYAGDVVEAVRIAA